MLEALTQTISVNFSITLNSIIYFLKRGRITRGLFHKVGYEHSALTQVLVAFGILHSLTVQLFKSMFLAATGFGLLYVLQGSDNSPLEKPDFFWIIFMPFYILLSLTKNKILLPEKKKYICIKLMRMDAKKYVLADYFPKLIWHQLIEIPLFAILAYLFTVNVFLVLFLVIGKNFISIFSEVLNIKFYEITGEFLHNKNIPLLAYSIVVLVLGYANIFTGTISHIPTPIILALGIAFWGIGIYSLIFIIKYKHYSLLLHNANRLDKINIDITQVKKDAQFSNVKLKDKEFTNMELRGSLLDKKEGFAFINDLFFKRHRRILNKTIKLQLLVIALLFPLALFASTLVPDFHTAYIKVIQNSFPAFIFALYLLSNGQKATKAMFYNCDLSLLHYGFYKTSGAVLTTFTIRTKHLIMSNILPSALFSVELILLDLILGGSGVTFVPVAIMLLVISIFFVVHNLFLYYIFQPYTTDLNVKNPFYKFFSFITYLLSYLSLQLKICHRLF